MLTLNAYLQMGQTTLSNGVLNNYVQLNMTDAEVLLYIHLANAQQAGDFFPAPDLLAFRMGKDVNEIYNLLSSLQQKKLLALKTYVDDNQMKFDRYDLTVIFERLAEVQAQQSELEKKMSAQDKTRELFKTFEQEFGRGLSGFELEMINDWLQKDHYQIDVILLALKEAVLNQAFSFKYIDRILLSWESKNIKTKEQVLQEQNKRQKEQREQTSFTKDDVPEIPFVPWLKPKDAGDNK